MPVCEVSAVPVGTDDPSFSRLVAEACEACKGQGATHPVPAMATSLEGPLPALLDCARAMHAAVLHAGCRRVATHVSTDHRTDRRTVWAIASRRSRRPGQRSRALDTGRGADPKKWRIDRRPLTAM